MVYSSANFNIKTKKIKDGVLLTQTIDNPIYKTSGIPETVNFLDIHMATIFNNQCFNDQKLSFREEVRDTEIPHLFEHMLIENMKMLAIKKFGKASMHGETYWDFDKPQGEYNIKIKSSQFDNEIFSQSLVSSINLLEKLFGTKE